MYMVYNIQQPVLVFLGIIGEDVNTYILLY